MRKSLCDLNRNQVSDQFCISLKINNLVRPGPAGHVVTALSTSAFHQNIDTTALQPLILFESNLLLPFLEDRKPSLLDLRFQLALKLGGASPFEKNI